MDIAGQLTTWLDDDRCEICRWRKAEAIYVSSRPGLPSSRFCFHCEATLYRNSKLLDELTKEEK